MDTYIAESEAESEGRAALFAAIPGKIEKSEAESEGGAALFAAILTCVEVDSEKV